MSEPIAFISHFVVKQGKRDDVTRLFQDVAERLEADKPRTLVFLAYFNETATQVSFLHVFADAESMDIHFQGSDERGRAAYEYVDPAGWEFYGRPQPASPGNDAAGGDLGRRPVERRAGLPGRVPASQPVVTAGR